jgi:predicted AAA+ superfamily ATPase
VSIKREVRTYIKELEDIYSVITITGPRQSGKTTLCKQLYPNKPYVNLEKPTDREFALSDPERFLAQYPMGAIIDEIQKAPELLSYIQVDVDDKPQKAKFILTGSQNFSLINNLSQSLAGRTGLVKLLPFSITELQKSYKIDPFNIEKLILNGFYPKIYDKNARSSIVLEDYTQTYLERDLRDWAKIQDLNLFRKFIKACAARVGQVLNMENIAQDLGISQPTVKNWLTLLEASYLVFLLQPYNGNLNKQLIKSPKLYFYDVGLVCHLLGIEKESELVTHSLRGQLFENLVIGEILKKRFNAGKNNNLLYYRDKRHEVDLLYKEAENYYAIEIKSAATFHHDFTKNLDYIEKILTNKIKQKILIYSSKQTQNRSDFILTNHFKILKLLD